MKLAINTVCLHHHSLDDALNVCAGAGFTNIELLAVQGWKHVEAGKISAWELLDKAAALGLRYSGVHAGGIGAADEAQERNAIAYIETALTLAKELSADHIVFSGFGWPEGLTPARREAICRQIGRALKGLLPKLEAANIPVALENHYHCQIETVQDYLWAFEEAGDSPLLGVTLDTGHFTSSGVDLLQAARTLGPRTVNVHIKDHVATQSVALGTGNTDNAALVGELAKIGYKGYLTCELEVADYENIVRHVNDAKPYMEKLT
ncbi:MAG: sugar phosphate isomerase/epimerase [Phycisphaerae bacterium]|nr:sugar phosphate isomerase/epimerase [Phycisphaerae bacterium]